jgi:hypothetical protein
MLTRITAVLLAACLAASVWPVQANVPRSEADIGMVVVQPRMPYPSREMVLRALPKGPPRKNVRIEYEVQLNRVGPSRSYPLVGAARFVETHFKCVVDSDQGREVVFIDMSRLDPTKG